MPVPELRNQGPVPPYGPSVRAARALPFMDMLREFGPGEAIGNELGAMLPLPEDALGLLKIMQAMAHLPGVGPTPDPMAALQLGQIPGGLLQQAQMHPLATAAQAFLPTQIPGLPDLLPLPPDVLVYHGTPMRKIYGLDPRHAVETRGALFFNDNPDVAEIFRYPREYGEVLTDVPRGRLIKADVNLKNPKHLYGQEAQKFTDDTVYQGQIVNAAKSAGHDGIIAHDVKEGVGDWTERGSTYAVFDPSSYKIISGISKKKPPPAFGAR